ncbi:homoserine O- acetyltransferase [Nowakowskiella sp. JEL0407]|nr:homoserine O- acetyltransferase [Nowakowskiella sp. JEL0407]
MTLNNTNSNTPTPSENKFAALIPDQIIATIPTFELEYGGILKDAPVAYKTWGKLNESKDNVMVICHALSGSADVEDWWGPLLGPGRAFDPNLYFIFCGNVLGSPYGSASPVTVNPETSKVYGPDFPLASIRDDVRIHKAILDTLGVKSVQFVIGGSMGGMQALEWAFFGKVYVKNIIPIATSARHSAWGISWGEAQRQAIYSDPNYENGYYTADKLPHRGLGAARMTALLTYRSRNSFESRFGRKVMPTKKIEKSEANGISDNALHHNEGHVVRLHSNNAKEASAELESETDSRPPPPVFSAQSYLRYQGDKFVNRFDANCYIAITRKMDTHDVSRGRGDLKEVLESVQQPTLVIGIETDGLFTISEQYELHECIPNSQLEVIQSEDGHDGFLIEFQQMNQLILTFLKENAPELYTNTNVNTDQVITAPTKASLFGEAEGDILQCLPYIDKDYEDPSVQEVVRDLLTAEKRLFSPDNSRLPDEISLFSSNPMLQAELLRVETGKPLNALDLSRYRLEPPTNTEDESKWQKSVQNARAQLESQHNRLINLELLHKFGANAWKLHNFQLEQMNKTVKAAVERNKLISLEINKSRKVEQMSANNELQILDAEWKGLISNVLRVDFANQALEAENEMLKAELTEMEVSE